MQRTFQNSNTSGEDLRNSILHGPIMILEILNIINSAEDEISGRRNVIDFINMSPRELKDDTKTVLIARKFTVSEIPKLLCLNSI